MNSNFSDYIQRFIERKLLYHLIYIFSKKKVLTRNYKNFIREIWKLNSRIKRSPAERKENNVGLVMERADTVRGPQPNQVNPGRGRGAMINLNVRLPVDRCRTPTTYASDMCCAVLFAGVL